MIIGDELLTKIMLTDTITKNDKLRNQISQDKEFSKLFSSILNQLLNQQNSTLINQEFDAQFSKTISNSNLFQTLAEEIEGLDTLLSNSNEKLAPGHTTAEQIDQVLNGKLTGMGTMFVSAGQKYNLDPALLVAIAQHETGNGKSRAAHEKNNIAGMMGKNGLKSYSTVEDSIMDMARNLSENYFGKGLSTIAEIGAKYAPIGVANDPTGLNNYWVKGVTKYYDQIKLG